MDHDRQDGEGIGPQEYTGIKMEVAEWGENALPILEAAKDKLAGRKVYLVAATLRPETMYGQTNCFVGPSITYGVFSANDQEAYLCTRRAARSMAFQSIITPRAEPNLLFEIDGSSSVGTRIKAPFAINPEVYVLPMENVLPTKVCIFPLRCRLFSNRVFLLGYWCRHVCPVRLSRRLSDFDGPAQESSILWYQARMGRH